MKDTRKIIYLLILFFLSTPSSASTFEFSKWQITEFEKNRFEFEKSVRKWVDKQKYDIDCSPFHCVALHEGNVWSIGLNNVGQLGLGHTTNVYEWTQVFLSDVDFVSLGFYHSYFLQNNTMYAVGDNRCSQLGRRGSNWSSNPVVSSIKNGAKVKQISAGGYFGLALLENGDVYGIGCNNRGQLIKEREKMLSYWKKLDLKNISKISAGGYHAYALDNEGELYGSGDQKYGQLGFYDPYTKGFMKLHKKNIKDVSAGIYHGYILTNDGILFSVGRNDKGQLGYNSNRRYSGRWKKTLENVTYVEAGAYHGHAYIKDEGLFAVGYNIFEQLGKKTESAKESEWIKVRD